ncbi:MAG: hypothetical protein R6V53_05180 [Candidatus Woesearchaeota archaeon]
MFDRLFLFSTGLCTNDCVSCCQSEEPAISFQHIRHPGIEKLLEAFRYDDLSVTGGDPLRNPWLLEKILDFHLGSKSISLNPFTFFCLENDKRGKDISRNDARSSLVKGISGKSRELADVLSYYDYIRVDSGTLQAPHEAAASWSLNFFEQNIRPLLRGKVVYATLDSSGASCMGAFRKFGKPRTRYKPKTFPCKVKGYAVSCEDDKIRLHICCSEGMSEHIASYHTGISLDDLVGMKRREIKKEIRSAAKKYQRTALHKLLRGKNSSFLNLFDWTKDYLNGKGIAVYSSNQQAKPCEVCYTLGLALKRSNRTVDEYQQYIEDRQKYL